MHAALINSLVVCGAGTAVAVVIGLTFSWIVVRTDTPCKTLIAATSILPLFVPPLVAAVAWSILGSPRTGLLNTIFAGFGLDWRVNVYSMAGLIIVFGMYYAPYVYMFTSAALRNMDPALEEAAEVSGANPIIARFMPDTIKALSSSLMQIHREGLEEASWICGRGLVGTIRAIVLPLARPGVVAAMALLFILAIRELGSSRPSGWRERCLCRLRLAGAGRPREPLRPA